MGKSDVYTTNGFHAYALAPARRCKERAVYDWLCRRLR
jgi:hypothetical protein